MNIAEIEKEMWAELVRMIRGEAPAGAAKDAMTIPEYLTKVHRLGRCSALNRKAVATDGVVLQQCEPYDQIRSDQILSDAIVPTEQDARDLYDRAHTVNYADVPEGYLLPRLLWYFIGRRPELADAIINGPIPDVLPSMPEQTTEPAAGSAAQGKGKPKKQKLTPAEISAWESCKWVLKEHPEMARELKPGQSVSKKMYAAAIEESPFYQDEEGNPLPRPPLFDSWTRYIRSCESKMGDMREIAGQPHNVASQRNIQDRAEVTNRWQPRQ